MNASSRLIVPPLDRKPWPTLGPEVCDWIEANLVHGPGDILGEPIGLTDEERLFIYRVYEVFPHGHERAGRRRFKRCVYCRRKGCRKTELAAWLAIAESHPQAPVRADGFRRSEGEWIPVGRGIRDPYIPMLSTTVEQTEDLAYGAVYEILTQDTCAVSGDYLVTLDRVQHRRGGKLQALAGSPAARDGARTSFQHFDETHLYDSPRLRRSHSRMLNNIPKRIEADAWSLETTTMYGPGEGSVAEDAHKLAEAMLRGEVIDSTLYFDHRQASERWNLAKDGELEKAIIEASGDAIRWTDVPTIKGHIREEIRVGKENEVRRYWLGQARRSSSRWHPVVDLWGQRKHDTRAMPTKKSKVVLAFDGSYRRDSTVLIGATVAAKPHVFVVKAWEKPFGQKDWRVNRTDVMEEVAKAMEVWQVVELAPDPPGWHREIEEWEQTYEEVVVRFETNQPSRMGPACDDFEQAVTDGDLTHDGSEIIARHLGNCVPIKRRGHSILTKESDDSPNKIDAAIGAIIAHHRAAWRFQNPPEPGLKPLVAWTN